MRSPIATLDPVPTLLDRLRGELAADFDFARSFRVARAPGRLDVMGGIADYTGSLVCQMPLDLAAAVAVQDRRADGEFADREAGARQVAHRQVQVFSFNLLDEHKPFTVRIPLEALMNSATADLRREFAEPGRHWSAYIAGCLHILHVAGLVDLSAVPGLNVALLSTVPPGAGVSSSAAIEVATMSALIDHFGIPRGGDAPPALDRAEAPNAGPTPAPPHVRPPLSPMDLAILCQRVENEVAGAPCGIMDQAASIAGRAGMLMRLRCQPHELLAPLAIPPRMRFVGIDTGVRHSVAGGQYARTRCAAFMAHKIILHTMKQIGAVAGRELLADPLNGYLANLEPDDYKRIFRPRLPDQIKGGEFLLKYGPTIDTATKVHADATYDIVHAADHHVLEARRVRNFCQFLDEANAMGEQAAGSRDYGLALDKAGHLMYASHQSYMMDAMLGCAEAELLVMLLRQRERQGLYGARITGGGQGGTVALLCEQGEHADRAIAQAMSDYAARTGMKPALFAGSSDGAWATGSAEL